MPIVEAVLVELDLQHLAGDGDEGEVGKFDQKYENPEICCIHVYKGKAVSRRGVEKVGKVRTRQNGRRKVRELLYLSVAYAANTGGVCYSDAYI